MANHTMKINKTKQATEGGVIVKKNKKITQNILLTAVMATMPLLVVRGNTYQIGLIIECIAAVISLFYCLLLRIEERIFHFHIWRLFYGYLSLCRFYSYYRHLCLGAVLRGFLIGREPDS